MTKSERWMAVAVALSERGRALTSPNPNVGCVIVKEGRLIGRGWTQSGGRPHAEEMALKAAGASARGSTAYVTLEPCAHISERGPCCADRLIAADVAKVVIALIDPDPRTAGGGRERLLAAGVVVETGCLTAQARRSMAGWLSVIERGRPFVTLKLATSLDGCIALANGESRWITGNAARAHAHLERARSDMILVGRGTYEMDRPKLDVRLIGLEDRSPRRAILTSAPIPDGWTGLDAPAAIMRQGGIQHLLVEGGAQTAASFLKAGLVDRLLLYRAPIMIGRGRASLGDIELDTLDAAHGIWRQADTRQLGSDTLEVYEAL